jgi:hypothetical protein
LVSLVSFIKCCSIVAIATADRAALSTVVLVPEGDILELKCETC